MTRNVIPAIEQSAGVGWAGWALLAAVLLIGAVWLLAALMRHADTPPPPAPAARRVYRCQSGRGPERCPGQATRMVALTDGMAVMCDSDAQLMVRIGRGVDLGPIDRTRA